jgi:hypothetical protein
VYTELCFPTDGQLLELFLKGQQKAVLAITKPIIDELLQRTHDRKEEVCNELTETIERHQGIYVSLKETYKVSTIPGTWNVRFKILFSVLPKSFT